jgi:hypothetical protein
MPKVNKKLRLQKEGNALPGAYPWIKVPRPEGLPLPKKVVEINEMLRKMNWEGSQFGPNAK